MANNATGFAALDAHIARLRSLPGIAGRAAPDVAESLLEVASEDIAAGKSPDGSQLQPTKEGAQPLRNAASALHVGAIGSTIIMRLTGPEARHHRGIARGGVIRQLIPTTKIPAQYAKAITEVLDEHFRTSMRS